MATILYRLGRLAFRRRWYVVLAWVAVLAGTGLASSTAAELPDAAGAMPGIEAQAAFELMKQRFPGTAAEADSATARIVFVAPSGEKLTDPTNRAPVNGLVDEVSRGVQVAGIVNPFEARAVSRDGSTAYATVTYQAPYDDLTEATKDALRTAVERARAAGLTVEIGGQVLATESSVGGTSELVGIAIAALVLLVMFGSVVAAGLPLVTAVLGVGVSMFAITALGSLLGLSEASSVLAAMLGLAVGIDYALFVLARYREERANRHGPEEAVGLAVATAGSAVIFAGLTVIVALAGLMVVGIPAAGTMGLTAAGAVAIAVLVALTLIPALLGFCPTATLARRVRKNPVGTSPDSGNNAGSRWARFVLRRPVLVTFGSVIVLAVLAVPVANLQLGLPGDEAKSVETTERRAYDALAKGFGPGFNGPLTIVVDARGASDRQAAVRTIAAAIAGTPGVVFVSPPRFNQHGDTALFTATPSTAPTSAQTERLVQRIRDDRPATESGTGAAFLVSGTTAVNIDFAQKVRGALVPYLAVVVGLAFLLLLMIFRSLVVPFKAVLGFLLSLLAALGAVVAVFQWGWGAELIGLEKTGPVISLMPIVLVAMTFGLAMDYQVFLVSRILEAHSHGAPAREAVVTGFRHSARVVVAAALIMIAVFAGFVGGDLAMIKTIGFGLAVAVLFDAFVVRMALMPAVLALLGERAWSLPRRLDRLLPQVDVEGKAIRRDTTRPPVATEPATAAGRESRDGGLRHLG